jgi:hypothetical protein
VANLPGRQSRLSSTHRGPGHRRCIDFNRKHAGHPARTRVHEGSAAQLKGAKERQGLVLGAPDVATSEGDHARDSKQYPCCGEQQVPPCCRSIHKRIAPEGPVPGRDVTPWCKHGAEREERQDEIAGEPDPEPERQHEPGPGNNSRLKPNGVRSGQAVTMRQPRSTFSSETFGFPINGERLLPPAESTKAGREVVGRATASRAIRASPVRRAGWGLSQPAQRSCPPRGDVPGRAGYSTARDGSSSFGGRGRCDGGGDASGSSCRRYGSTSGARTRAVRSAGAQRIARRMAT